MIMKMFGNYQIFCGNFQRHVVSTDCIQSLFKV